MQYALKTEFYIIKLYKLQDTTQNNKFKLKKHFVLSYTNVLFSNK